MRINLVAEIPEFFDVTRWCEVRTVKKLQSSQAPVSLDDDLLPVFFNRNKALAR